jgi:hypothetical protein
VWYFGGGTMSDGPPSLSEGTFLADACFSEVAMTHARRTSSSPGRTGRWSAVALALLLPAIGRAATYEVGPGQLANVGDVPWESLNPGDTVLIHWRATSYKEKFVLCRQGTQAQPIVVRGLLGPAGERPVLEGNGATTRSALDFWNEDRGVIKIGGANKPADLMPQWIVVENLEVVSARAPYTFTGRDGTTPYAKNAASIYIEKGENLVIRNCVMRDSANGLFCGAQTKNLLVEANHLFDNGNDGSIYEHNNYTAAVGITFQYNHFGPLRTNCLGNNLKDRSVGTVIRYNWIDGGNRALDLVDAEDDPSLISDPRYRSTFVYGNVLIKGEGGNNQVAHYGGDSGDPTIYRKGTLYFFNNTLISTRAGTTTLLRLSTNDEHADVRNNILYVTAAGSQLGMLDSAGVLDLWNNWLKPGWVQSHSGLTGTLDNHGGAANGTSPGFANEGAQDFHLAGGSGCLDKGTTLAAAALPNHALAMQYRVHQASEPRPTNGALDLGAFEACPSGSCAGLDAGTVPDAAAPGLDAAHPGADAATRPDAAQPGSDAAQPGADAGQTNADASISSGDGAAAIEPDASSPTADTGSPAIDAGTGDSPFSAACGCSANGPPALAGAVFALAFLPRRRRPA